MKLNKCPFCGSEDVRAELNFKREELVISCRDCPVKMRFEFPESIICDDDTLDVEELEEFIRSAANTWNGRAE